MQKLLDYAYLSTDKIKRDTAIDDYENLRRSGKIKVVSHAEAVKRLYNIKYKMGAFIKRLPKNLMIAGSTALACVIEDGRIVPHDIDIYMNDNDHKTVAQIDRAIRETYNTEIILMRTQYTINWFLRDDEHKNYPIIQLVLPPVRHWSEVFSSSHSDLVCIGYLTGREKFIYGRGRWDRFYVTGVSYGTTSFTDEEYKQRVYDAIDKYCNYGFEIETVSTDNIIVKNQIENSPRFEVKVVFEDIGQFILKNPQVTVGKYLHNIYSGEIFKDYIETMSMFNRCPICSSLIVEKKVCDSCTNKEEKKTKFIRDILKSSDKDIKYLVTGGRCGLGNEISNILMKCGRDVTVTTRFPQLTDGKKAIKLDMKDPKSVEEFEKEVGNFDVLILSAAETLHYAGNNLPPSSAKDGKLDWTNDFHRDDTGIWHKCIDEHTNEEIEDPIQINITSIAKIIRSFIAHQVKNKLPSKQKAIVYVTSSEGAFTNKSPFHPVTNMTKSAIEQLICTMKRQADVLGMKIVMADPGWMYTKSTNGKNVGPITLEWGASQILSPLANILNGDEVENGSLWRRQKDGPVNADTYEETEIKFKGSGETCPTTLDDSNVMVLLSPCQHKLGLPGWYQLKNNSSSVKCPLCRREVQKTEIVSITDSEGEGKDNEEDKDEDENEDEDDDDDESGDDRASQDIYHKVEKRRFEEKKESGNIKVHSIKEKPRPTNNTNMINIFTVLTESQKKNRKKR